MKNFHSKWISIGLTMLLASSPVWGQIPHREMHKKKVNEPFKTTQPVRQSAQPLFADDEIPILTVLDEDFSLWTAGSNDTPDTEKLGGSEVSYVINDNLMKTPGWRGNGVYQAGGACLLGKYVNDWGEDSYGFIQTPEMELYGELVLTFKAKAFDANTTKLRVALCDNKEGPRDDRDFNLSAEWQSFTFATDAASFSNINIFQFTCYDAQILIDDIKITRKRNRIPTPVVYSPLNLSTTSFMARWQSTDAAKSYILNIYRKEMPENAIPRTTVVEGFDGINVLADGQTIDATNPNYPEGWEIDLSSKGEKDVYTTQGDWHSAPLSLNFDAVGDKIISPTMPAPITSFRFWVKPSSMDLEPNWTYSLMQVSVYTEQGGWSAIANIYNQWMTAEGGYYTFDSEMIGEDVTRVKLEILQRNLVSFAVDDMEIVYESQPQPVTQLKTELTETSHVYDTMDPQYEYFYNVSARDGSLYSAPSNNVWVDGIIGLKPVVKEATNVTENGFTANWEGFHNAGYYKVNTYRIFEAKEDMSNVVLLHEDFNKITQGTLEKPEVVYNTHLNLAEKGLTDTDWVLQLPQMANGMAGARETNFWMGIAGLVGSPKLDLICNNGAFDVDFTVYNTMPGDTLFVLIMKELTDNQAMEAQMFAMNRDQAGFNTGTVHFGAQNDESHRKNVIIAFMSMYGQPFFVDDVTIRQNMMAGEKMTSPYKVYTSQETSLQVTDLPAGTDYAYDVIAVRKRYYEVYTSDTSDRCVVKLGATGGVNDAAAETAEISASKGQINVSMTNNGYVKVYDLQGRCVASAHLAMGTHTISVAPSMYIVEVGGQKVKLLVP